MQDLYLLKDYSNYFNRKIRKHATLQDYKDAVSDYYLLANTNFVIGDGVTASHTIGSSSNPYNKDWCPDYILVVDHDTQEITSRWFVTNFAQNMGNQHVATMKRDVIADFYEQVVNAPCFVEKGYLENTDPLILNSEGMSLNQIKKKEYFIKDRTRCPWIVGYLPQENRTAKSYIATYGAPKQIPYIETDSTLRSLFYYEESGTPKIRTNQVVKELSDANKNMFMGLGIDWGSGLGMGFASGKWNINNVAGLVTSPTSQYGGGLTKSGGYSSEQICAEIIRESNPAILSNYDNVRNRVMQRIGGMIYSETGTKAPRYDSEFNCRSSTTGKNYRLKMTITPMSYNINAIPGNVGDNIVEIINAIDPHKRDFIWNTVGGIIKGQIPVQGSYLQISYKLEESGIDQEAVRVDIESSTAHVNDEPYDIFCMPLGEITVKDGSTVLFTTIPQISINMGRAIAAVAGNLQDCYDVQILPYCPCNDLIQEDGSIDIHDLTVSYDYEMIHTNTTAPRTGTNKSIMLFSTRAFRGFEVNKIYEDLYDNVGVNINSVMSLPNNNYQLKLVNECDMYRFCSPNYNGLFDFNLAKNGGFDSISIDVVFRPFTPYIHVAPKFGLLYGQSFSDVRGLICGGDFSLTIVQNQWATYQLNNKNYQNIFDRQIQNMDAIRDIGRERDLWGIGSAYMGLGSGLFGAGAATGIAAGFMKYPGAGIAGGVAGGIGSGVRGIFGIEAAKANRNMNEQLYKESRSFAIDMFNMRLDNIKALPDSLTKTSSISSNYKFFPYIEYYSCTEEEKFALYFKLRTNGMRVGRIDYIINHLGNNPDNENRFVKGQMIRLDDLGVSSHIANDIYNEVNSGLFFMPQGV